MKKLIAASLLLLFIVIGCNRSAQNSLLQSPDEMVADEYVINIDKETTLLTKNGALLKIPKGALSSPKGSTVTLEIKEAYSIQQMIKAGLTTQSNGELLSSGGMIYINAKAGQDVTIKQSIKVAIPADNLEDGMQLFKGKTGEDGKINWSNPDTLPENKQLNSVLQGKQLFMGKCASCHTIGKQLVGPDLANIWKRSHIFYEGRFPEMHRTIAYRYETFGYTKSPFSGTESRHFSSSGCYHCNVKAMMYHTMPTLYTDLTYDEIDNIYNYIQNESDKRNLPMPSHAWLDDCIDSCEAYYYQTKSLQDQKLSLLEKQKEIITDNGPLVKEVKKEKDTTTVSFSDEYDTTEPIVFEEMVSPNNYESRYYQFTIETFGWFNIDILLKGKDGVEESELFVRLVGEYRKKAQVYLIIPSVKVYTQGGPAERNPEEFAFLYKTGKIFLPQGAKAYILAVSESSSSAAFAIKEFTTGKKQEFDLTLRSSTKEAFNDALGKLEAGNMKVTVKESKNADAVRQTEATLQTIDVELKKADGLKPKGCDCYCGTDAAATPVAGTGLQKDTIRKRGE